MTQSASDRSIEVSAETGGILHKAYRWATASSSYRCSQIRPIRSSLSAKKLRLADGPCAKFLSSASSSSFWPSNHARGVEPMVAFGARNDGLNRVP